MSTIGGKGVCKRHDLRPSLGDDRRFRKTSTGRWHRTETVSMSQGRLTAFAVFRPRSRNRGTFFPLARKSDGSVLSFPDDVRQWIALELNQENRRICSLPCTKPSELSSLRSLRSGEPSNANHGFGLASQSLCPTLHRSQSAKLRVDRA
jgi:hypothetical protein